MAARKSVLNKEVIEKVLFDAGICDVDVVIKDIEIQVNKTLKQKIKEAQHHVNESYDQGESFLQIYPEYEWSKLPGWIVDSIESARVIGNSKQTVILPDGRKYQLTEGLGLSSVNSHKLSMESSFEIFRL